MKKIIAIDMDGTLLNDFKEVPDTTREYMKVLRKNGHIVSIATGRTLSSALSALGEADYIDYIITEGGAAIYNVKEDKSIYEKIADIREAKTIFNNAVKEGCENFNIFTRNKLYKYIKENRKTTEANYIPIKLFEDFEKEEESIVHISITFNTNEKVENFARENSDFVNTRIYAMKDSFGIREWVEVMHKDVNKFNAILKVLELSNASSEDTICFGDSTNDLEMIERSGIGVAMKNAIPELKKVAKEVTNRTNNEKGVENWLKEFFKL